MTALHREGVDVAAARSKTIGLSVQMQRPDIMYPKASVDGMCVDVMCVYAICVNVAMCVHHVIVSVLEQ